MPAGGKSLNPKYEEFRVILDRVAKNDASLVEVMLNNNEAMSPDLGARTGTAM